MVFVAYSPYIPNMVPRELFKVTIQGGANLADKHDLTRRGVSTPISDREYEFLIADPKFLEVMADGHMVITNETDAEKAARDMKAKDRSAPKTPDDYRGMPNNTGGVGIKTGRTVEEIARPG